MQEQQQVLNIVEAASMMRCSKTHVLNIIHGRVPNLPPLPCIHAGRRVLIRRESFERWLAAAEAPTEVQA